MLPHIVSVAAFMAITFVVQATNHFVINTAHYARQPLISPEPVLWGGIAAMLIQGTILTFLYSRLRPNFRGVKGGLGFALLMGAFLGSYIALAEAAGTDDLNEDRNGIIAGHRTFHIWNDPIITDG